MEDGMESNGDFLDRHVSGARQFLLSQVAWYFDEFIARTTKRDDVGFGSPLERAFYVWFEAVSQLYGDGLGLILQHEVKANGKNYRLDFVLVSTEIGLTKVAVELDGHEFHERTREQVELRDRRDRDLHQFGWTVLHYSFGEFVKKPDVVAREVHTVAGMWVSEHRGEFWSRPSDSGIQSTSDAAGEPGS